MTELEAAHTELEYTRAETIERVVALSGKGRAEVAYTVDRLAGMGDSRARTEEARRIFAEEKRPMVWPGQPPVRDEAAPFFVRMGPPSDPRDIPWSPETISDLSRSMGGGDSSKADQIVGLLNAYFYEVGRFNLLVQRQEREIDQARARLAQLEQ